MIRQTIIKPFRSVLQWPKNYKIAAVSLVFIIIILVMWFWPRSISFAYHQSSCVNDFIAAPGLYKSTGNTDFRLVAGGEVKLAGVPVYATKMCVVPLEPPEAGVYAVNLAPFGWQFMGRHVTVSAEKPPVASVEQLQKEIPTTQPLELQLSAPDSTFSYALSVAGKQVDCKTKRQRITCEIEKLALAQGAEYAVALDRYFKGDKVATLTRQSVRTLRAATVTDSSIKPGEVVFAKPTGLHIKLDKKLKDAGASLVKITGDARELVRVKTSVKDDIVQVEWEGELPRLSNYELTLDNVEAVDESSLAAPYVLPFVMSGGPKVTGINVGRTKVPIGTTVVLTFDQPLLEGQNIAKAITASGGAAVTGVKGNQVFITTANVPKCGTFAIAVNDALISSHNVTGGSGWQYSSRTVCHTISSIGTSARGRSILAYHFGSGPNTIIYTGAIHGNELSTRSLMQRWIDELEANAQNIPADKNIIVVPALNPDGVASGTRTNANNVDLNRNFDVSDWKSDITTVTNAPFPGGGGTAPMSEPETRAIAQLVARLRPILVLSYHSIGGVVAGNLAGDSPALAATYSNLSGYRNVTGVTSSVFEYQVTGTADDYYLEKLAVRSLLIELGSHSYHQFERNQKAMWAMLKI